jgi:hypothetical protein
MKSSKELASKPVPFEYRVKIITAIAFDPQSGAKGSLAGPVSYWDYAAGKVVEPAKGTWAEGDAFGPKVSGHERYKIAEIGNGKVSVLDNLRTQREALSQKDNTRPVDLPPEVTEESAAAAAQPAASTEPADAGAGKKKKAEADDEDEKPVKKPAKKPAKSTKDAGKKKKAAVK